MERVRDTMSNRKRLRKPEQDYQGTCVACFTPTGHGIFLEGEGEFIIAALIKTGVPRDEAAEIVMDIAAEHPHHCDPGYLPVYDMLVPVRLCADCAAKGKFPRTGLMPLASVTAEGVPLPLYRQPETMRRLPPDLLEQAQRMHDEWVAEDPADPPLVVASNNAGLGSWTISELRHRAGEDQGQEVRVLRLLRPDYEQATDEERYQLHQMAEVIIGGTEFTSPAP